MLVYIIRFCSARVNEISDSDYRLIRAARSFAYNQQFLPVIAGRLERAEDKLRTCLLLEGLSQKEVGPISVMMSSEGSVSVVFNSLDGWEQLEIPSEDFFIRESSEYYAANLTMAVQAVDSLLEDLNSFGDRNLSDSLLDRITGSCDSLSYEIRAEEDAFLAGLYGRLLRDSAEPSTSREDRLHHLNSSIHTLYHEVQQSAHLFNEVELSDITRRIEEIAYELWDRNGFPTPLKARHVAQEEDSERVEEYERWKRVTQGR